MTVFRVVGWSALHDMEDAGLHLATHAIVAPTLEGAIVNIIPEYTVLEQPRYYTPSTQTNHSKPKNGGLSILTYLVNLILELNSIVRTMRQILVYKKCTKNKRENKISTEDCYLKQIYGILFMN